MKAESAELGLRVMEFKGVFGGTKFATSTSKPSVSLFIQSADKDYTRHAIRTYSSNAVS